MNRNYIPYLRFNQFEDDDYPPSHFNTGNDFFTIDKSYNTFDSNNNISYYQDNNSEFNHIIPQNMNYFDNRKIYKNNIFIETKDLSSQNNFVYSSKNIHFDDRNYQKYLLNIKNESNNRKKIINKKNNSQNKNTSNSETYNIIQIYEAPPLELTPISENEKNESIEKRKPPKYYRKKIIYTLEDKTENKPKNKLFDLDFNELEKISKKFESKEHENDRFLKAIKSSNSKNKKILNENREEKEVKNQKEKNYQRFLTKDINEKKDSKLNDSIINNETININYKKYIRKESEKENKINNNNYKVNSKIEDKENINKNIINGKDANQLKEKEMYKRAENKSFIQKQNYKLYNNNENDQKKLRFTIEKSDALDNNKNYLNKDEEKEGKKFFENKEEKLKRDNNIFESKERQKIFNNLDNNVGDKTIIKNLEYDKNTEQKNGNEKFDKNKNNKKEEPKEKLRTAHQITNKNSLRQINLNYNKEMISTEKPKIKENETKIEKNSIILNIEDKTQLSSNKRTYLYSKVKIDSAASQNGDKNKKIVNETNNNNLTKKYIYSFSVEKNKEGAKIFTDRKTNEVLNKPKLNNNEIKNKNDKELKGNKLDLALQIKNNNHSTISSKNEVENKNEKIVSNEDKMKNNNSNLDYLIKNKKRVGISTPNPQENNKVEENKNIDISSFGNTARKSMYNNNNYNTNTANIDKKSNILTENKKENMNNSKISNINKDIKKENNLKTIATHKNVYKSNHNYVAIKSSGLKKINNITQYKPKPEKSEKIDNNINYEGNPFISPINKIEQKENIIRENIRRLTSDINNCVNNNNNAIVTNNNANNNINTYQSLRGSSVKSVDIKIQNNNDTINKRKVPAAQLNNHSMKISYGISTFKSSNDKKENENKPINSNKNNEINNYIGNKNPFNNSFINNNNNMNNDNKLNGNSIVNIDKNRRDNKTKNNHSIYISIASKK